MQHKNLAAQHSFTAGNIRAAVIVEAYEAEPNYKSDTMEDGILLDRSHVFGW